MKAIINKEHIEGRVHSHTLAIKTVQDQSSANYGKTYIGGKLDVVTDEAGVNLISINFTYVTPTTKAGSKNASYAALEQIINSGKTVEVDGMENATMVRVDTSLGLNDFYTNRNGEETLVSAKINDGGFVSIINKLNPAENKRNTFEVDMLINGSRIVEADEEKQIEEHLVIKGCTFNSFRKSMLPIELTVKNPGGIQFFQSLDASPTNPVFTKVWGNIISQAIVTTKTEESAFGEPSVKEYTKNVREWVVNGASPNLYQIGDEQAGITVEEIQKAKADRDVYLADVKKRNDEYLASKAGGSTVASSAPAAQGGFNF